MADQPAPALPERAPTAARTRLAEGILLLVAILWGINPPIIKLGLQFISPLPYNVARMAVASLVALVALWLSGTHTRMTRADLGRIFRVSAFGFFVFQLFFTEGIQRTTSGNASFMLCLMPVSVLLLNRVFGLEKITRPVVFGIGASITGIALIVIGAGREVSVESGHVLGTLFILAAQAGYAYYTVFSKELLGRYSTYQVTAYLLVMTTILLLAAAAPATLAVDWSALPFAAWASILFSGILALCLCNFCWIWGTGILGTSRAAIFNNVSPVFAVITGYLVLGETFGALQAAGAGFVFAGVYITRHHDRLAAKPAAAP